MSASRTVRLFVSSTFSDLKAERDALQLKVFPRLQQLCLSAGFRFQAIDLRWGVSEEAGRDNKTMRICLRELARCQRDRPKPNFLILLGDRYGWRPLPEILPAALFAKLAAQLASTDPGAARLFELWYRVDENAVPPAAELQPRGEGEDWQEQVEKPLLAALEQAAQSLGLDLEKEAATIGASATEQEILEGALNVPDAGVHVRAFFRGIEGLPENPPPQGYVDIGDLHAKPRLEALKSRIERHIGGTNVCRYRVPWRGDGIGAGDLEEFCEQAWKLLSEVVEQQIAAVAAVAAGELEEQAHQRFGEERCRRFVGRGEPLDRIAAYLRQGPDQPLAVTGASGCGKSAVMARAAQAAVEKNSNARIVARYIGATAASSDLIQLLRLLVGEIRRHYPVPAAPDGEIPVELNPLVAAFHEALQRPTASQPLWIFLDSLDQLTASHQAHALAWLPARLSGNVRLVVSAALPDAESRAADAPDPRAAIMAALRSRLDAGQRVALAPLTAADGAQMLDNWLADARRTLRKPQREAILETFRAEGSPLWLRTATEEAVRLASWQPAPAFAPTTKGLLGQVLGRLSQEEEHGGMLVSRTLGYLACARHGLAEDEMLGILSADAEVMADFVRRSPNSPRAGNLPVAVWVRLHGDLAFYLAEHEAQEGSSLLGFYHRSILEAVKGRYLAAREDRRGRHRHMAEWFGQQAWFLAPVTDKAGPAEGAITDPPNARKASELPWHLYRTAGESDPEGGQDAVWQPLADALCDILFVEAKVRSGLVLELQEDYRLALDALPEMVSEVRERQEREARIARWTAEITAYARVWSERRDRQARGETVTEAEPAYPEPVSACRVWTDEEIDAEDRRIIEQPTRLDRLRAFAGFLVSECHVLLEFGKLPGSALQHAFNHSPGGPVHTAAAKRIAAAHAPLLLRRWPADARPNPAPALLRTLAGHSKTINSVSVTDGGQRAVSASEDNTLRVWDLESGECLRILEGHDEVIYSVGVTPDGRRAVSGSDDQTLRVWDLESGECLRTLAGHTALNDEVAVTPDGRTAVSAEYNEIWVWDLESGQVLRTLQGHTRTVTSVSVTPDGRRLVSASWDKTLRVWDLETGACLRTIEEHIGEFRGVRVTPDGRRAVSSRDDQTARVWNLESGKYSQPLEDHPEGPGDVKVTPDGWRAAAVSCDSTPRVWDLRSGECLQTLAGHRGCVVSLSLTADGRRAVSGSYDNTLRVWDLESGACLRTLAGHYDLVLSVSVTPDGRHAVSGSEEKTVRAWDLETGQCRVFGRHASQVVMVAVTPDGRSVWSGGDGTLRLWDLESGECLRILEGHYIDCTGVTVDGRRAVSGGSGGGMRMSDLETGGSRNLEGHSHNVQGIALTPDGRRAVSASWDKTLRVWDLESGKCLRTLEGHRNWVESVAVTSDGRYALSGSTDQTLRLWDLESGSCEAVFLPSAPVSRIATSLPAAAVICGTKAGETIILELHGIEFGPPLRAPVAERPAPTPAAAFPPAPRPRPFWRALSRVCRAVSYPWRRQSRT